MVVTNDDLEIHTSVLSTSIASVPGDDEPESGNGRTVADPIKEIPLIAADTRSGCCSDKRLPNQNMNHFSDGTLIILLIK